MTDENELAYSIQYEEEVGNHRRIIKRVEGLTKLEYFAGMALAGGYAPEIAVDKAKTLIDQLNKENQNQTSYESSKSKY